MAAMLLANNIANHTHSPKNIFAILLITNAKSVLKVIPHHHAKKTERKLVTTVKHHLKSSSDVTEPIKKTHNARDATKVTKDADNRSKFAKTVQSQLISCHVTKLHSNVKKINLA